MVWFKEFEFYFVAYNSIHNDDRCIENLQEICFQRMRSKVLNVWI